MNAIDLTIFSSRIESVCDEMGAVLRRSAFSPNIRDRLDYSCAIFDADGELCAQAAHIPVHLGSMAFAMRDIVSRMEWQDGDLVILNDPFLGGTHLPDVTMISPVLVSNEHLGFVVNRAHHADIGADTPGSMPISSHLDEEGTVIPPGYLLRKDKIQQTLYSEILSTLRNPELSQGDFEAQISANRAGMARLQGWISQLGVEEFRVGLSELNSYAERLSSTALKQIPDGIYSFEDRMEDDGAGNRDLPIKVSIEVEGGRINVDFSGTTEQTGGNINCPLSVAAAGVYYVFRSLMPPQTPAAAGSFRAITVTAPKGSLLNADRPAAVAAGNVETSSRVVDVVIGALVQAVPEKMAAASQGTMNNVAMGGVVNKRHWDYYETIGGGMGASLNGRGLSAVQTHMTNTLNTPVEVLEMSTPLQLTEYAVRRGSGGDGDHSGGDGIVRTFKFLEETTVTLLTERREISPWGVDGGSQGQSGRNMLDGELLPAKCSILVDAGQILSIETPGGGGAGYG
ncbi:MAG: hydantoinase B/oxoprolinase family protein [Gammaproteobacteria bacterium]|uniref:Hydantoinase B/oxoprolinase family protein n=1 Tax=Candidatus Thiopontia autotrophica TaxID=2841688 RepID=A0A8J6NX96_9GAMM|nr:hydantoinase B/oxoprolinase family protein [Candidatus Thiopontia autotrophica]